MNNGDAVAAECSMAKRGNVYRNFKLEGSRAELRCLMETIDGALKQREDASGTVTAKANIGKLTVEVAIRRADAILAVRLENRDEAAVLLEGWAENVKCINCEIPVALLFEENYYESSTGRGALCADCLQKELDGESA